MPFCALQSHKALQQWQDRERSMLRSAFEQVTVLEGKRLGLVTQASSKCQGSRRGSSAHIFNLYVCVGLR